jgi:predicted metal-dependent peptidase
MKQRHEGKEFIVWNAANDFVINLALKDSGLTVPEGGLIDDNFRGHNSESVYEKLMNDPKYKKLKDQLKTLDDHSRMNGSGNGKPDPIQEREWKAKIAQAKTKAKLAGKDPGGIGELVDKILNPKVNFKDLLHATIQNLVKFDHRLTPPNRRHIGQDYYLPSMYGNSFRGVIAIDSSGSVSTKELQYFLGVIDNILSSFHSYEIDIIGWSADVHTHKKLETGDQCKKLTFKDRGGTCVGPVFKWVTEKTKGEIDALIILTDGGIFDEPPKVPPHYPLIWVVTQPPSDKVKHGTTIRLEGCV